MDETRKLFKSKLRESRANLEASEDTLSAVTNEKAKLEITLKSVMEEREEYEGECQALKDTVRKLRASNQETSNRLDETIQELRDDLKSSKKAIDNIADEKSMLEEECKAMKSTLQLQQDSAETISSLETRNKQIESELSSKISELK